jgi:A/G-specific adenine glycosylase
VPRPRNNSHHSKLVAALLDWFAANARDLPWRRTRDPYAIWVSEIMLQQTQVKTVIPFWERWMRELPSIAALAAARPDKIHKLWEGLGYYTRVRNMQKAAQWMVERTRAANDGFPLSTLTCPSGTLSRSRGRGTGDAGAATRKARVRAEFPRVFEEVLALPGVGRYTAGAICSIAFNQPAPILDGNVMRVLTRVFGIAENPKEKTTNAKLWKLAEQLVTHAVQLAPRAPRPAPHASHLNQSLMELGALVCTPRGPQCGACPVKKLCAAFRDNRVEELPRLGKRAAPTARRFVALVVERDGKYLVRQRPAGVVNAHLWEFPNVELPPLTPALSRRTGEGESLGRPVGQARHPLLSVSRTGTGSGRPGQSPPPEVKSSRQSPRIDGFRIIGSKPLCTVKHSITRYRITLEAYRAEISEGRVTRVPDRKGKNGARSTRPSKGRPSPARSSEVWLTLAALDRLAFTGAHRKILQRL